MQGILSIRSPLPILVENNWYDLLFGFFFTLLTIITLIVMNSLAKKILLKVDFVKFIEKIRQIPRDLTKKYGKSVTFK